MIEGREHPRDIDKLRHVPVFAVRDLLKSRLGEEARLASLTGEQLIELARNTPDITQADIEAVFEDFRYGGRACFYIHLLRGDITAARIQDLQAWNAAFAELHRAGEDGGCSIQARDVDELQEGITEIRYAYATLHKYIDRDEGAASVVELNFGFVWLNPEHRYMLVMSRLETVNLSIARAVESLLGCSVVAARLPKNFTDRHFHVERISRGSWYDGRTGVRHSLAADDLLHAAGEQLTVHEQTHVRVASLHRERIREDLESKLGLQMKRGKIYLTNIIRASDLRRWMYTRLHPFAVELQHLPPRESVIADSSPVPQLGLSGRGEAFFREIVSGILRKQEDRGWLVVLSATADAIYASMHRYFLEPKPSFQCGECGDLSPICCPQCGDENLRVHVGVLKCSSCAYLVSGQRVAVQCSSGHTSTVERPATQLVLCPNTAMLEALGDFVNSQPGCSFNRHEEFFWIDSTELHYTRNRQPAVLLPHDISAFAELPGRAMIPDDLWQRGSLLVRSLGEKCTVETGQRSGQPKGSDCQECYERKLGRLCIPKLFQALHGDFAPTPHGGAEFGDAGLPVVINGVRNIFVGICKKARKRPVRARDAVAGDIIRQIISQVLRDQRAQVFGIAVPAALDAEVQGTIQMLARMAGKPVIFFGLEELTVMCCALLSDPAHSPLEQASP